MFVIVLEIKMNLKVPALYIVLKYSRIPESVARDKMKTVSSDFGVFCKLMAQY